MQPLANNFEKALGQSTSQQHGLGNTASPSSYTPTASSGNGQSINNTSTQVQSFTAVVGGAGAGVGGPVLNNAGSAGVGSHGLNSPTSAGAYHGGQPPPFQQHTFSNHQFFTTQSSGMSGGGSGGGSPHTTFVNPQQQQPSSFKPKNPPGSRSSSNQLFNQSINPLSIQQLQQQNNQLSYNSNIQQHQQQNTQGFNMLVGAGPYSHQGPQPMQQNFFNPQQMSGANGQMGLIDIHQNKNINGVGVHSNFAATQNIPGQQTAKWGGGPGNHDYPQYVNQTGIYQGSQMQIPPPPPPGLNVPPGAGSHQMFYGEFPQVVGPSPAIQNLRQPPSRHSSGQKLQSNLPLPQPHFQPPDRTGGLATSSTQPGSSSQKGGNSSIFGGGIWAQPKEDGSSIGYFLPDFIEDEIEDNSRVGSLVKESLSADNLPNPQQRKIGTNLSTFAPPPGLPIQQPDAQQQQYLHFIQQQQMQHKPQNLQQFHQIPMQQQHHLPMPQQQHIQQTAVALQQVIPHPYQTQAQIQVTQQTQPNPTTPQQIKFCSKCSQQIGPHEHFVTSSTPMPGAHPGPDGQIPMYQVYSHFGCVASSSQVHPQTSGQATSAIVQPQIPPVTQSNQMSSMIQLTPEMLVFDFQILHPLSLTTIFQLQSQSSPHNFADKANQTITFNKLICSSTTIPFNVAIVSFKWDFFREPSAIVEGLSPMDPIYQQQLASLPQRPQNQNFIQGQINFLELLNFNEKNLTITLKANPRIPQNQQETYFMTTQGREPSLTLNFNYNIFKDALNPQQADSLTAPSNIHLLRNLYMSFALSQNEFESLKLETMRLIHQNPQLVSLLRTPPAPQQEHHRFVTVQNGPQGSQIGSGNSLHQLLKGNLNLKNASSGILNQNGEKDESLNKGTNDNSNQSDRKTRNQSQANQNSQMLSSEFSEISIEDKDNFKKVGSGAFLEIKKPRKGKRDASKASNDSRMLGDTNIKIDNNNLAVEDDTNSQMDSLILDGNDGEESPENINTVEEEQKTCEKSKFATCRQSTVANNPGYMLRKTKIGIEISSLEENQAVAMSGINRTKTNSIIDRPSLCVEKLSGQIDSDLQEENSGSSSKSNDSGSKTGGLSNKSKTVQLQDSSQNNSNTKSYLEPKTSKKKLIQTQNSTQSIRSINSEVSMKSSEISQASAGAGTTETDENNAQLLNEMRGKVVELAKQQHGSKQLQKILARASPDFVNFAIEECLHDMHELMVDAYGNYFCQKLLQSSSSAQRHKILNVLRPNILKISCDKKGTHSMQCLIEMINMPEEEQELKEGISQHIVSLAFDPNGTHVLQKVLLCMKEENIDFIFDPILANFVDLSMDQNGLCVIKKIVSKIQGHEKRLQIGKVLSDNVVQLVQNPYGNYAVQQALDNWTLEYCLTIFQKLEPHLMQLSVQKFSSNVIERVLEKSEYDTVERFMKRLCDIEVMKGLIKNTYGFYVMQKLVQVLRKHKASIKPVQQAVQDTIQYATDKTLRQKWQGILTQPHQQAQQTGPQSLGNQSQSNLSVGGNSQSMQHYGNGGAGSGYHHSQQYHHGGSHHSNHGGNYQGNYSQNDRYYNHHYGGGNNKDHSHSHW